MVCHSRGGLTARSFVESVLSGSRLARKGRPGGLRRAPPTRAPTSPTRPAGPISPTCTPTSSPPTRGRSPRCRAGARSRRSSSERCAASVPGALARLVRRPTRTACPVSPRWSRTARSSPTSTRDQRGQPRSGTPWFVVSSDFEVTVDDHPPEMPVAVVTRLVDGVVDHVFTGPNDLVVDVDSMSAIDLPARRRATSATSSPYRRTALSTTRTTSPSRSSPRPSRRGWCGGSTTSRAEEQAAPVPDTDSESDERGVAWSLAGARR